MTFIVVEEHKIFL